MWAQQWAHMPTNIGFLLPEFGIPNNHEEKWQYIPDDEELFLAAHIAAMGNNVLNVEAPSLQMSPDEFIITTHNHQGLIKRT